MQSASSSDTEPSLAENIQRTSTGRIRAVQHPLDALLFHPLAARLARLLARTSTTPNMVSFAGGLAVALAGIVYAQCSWPYAVLLGFLIHAVWHILDGADGDLARLTSKASPQGEVFDGICDYAGHIVLYVVLAWLLSGSVGWSAFAFAAGAGASRVLQANFYESQRRQYMQWVHGVAWLRTDNSGGKAESTVKLGAAYLKLAALLAPSDPAVERALADPTKAERIRERLIKLGAKSLYGSTLLGAPYRTLALGLAMLAGSPIWYFLFEIVFLNFVLVISIWRARRSLAHLRQLA